MQLYYLFYLFVGICLDQRETLVKKYLIPSTVLIKFGGGI